MTISPGPAPVISGLSETKRVFAPSRVHHSGGTVFKLRLDQPAQITIWIQTPRPWAPHRMQLPPVLLLGIDISLVACSTVLVGMLHQRGASGRNRITLSGHLNGRPLAPGSYVAVFNAYNGFTRVQAPDAPVHDPQPLSE